MRLSLESLCRELIQLNFWAALVRSGAYPHLTVLAPNRLYVNVLRASTVRECEKIESYAPGAHRCYPHLTVGAHKLLKTSR